MFESLNKPLESEKIEAEVDEIRDAELEEILSEREKLQIEKEAQAKAIVDKYTSDPKAMITSNISKTTLDLITSKDKFKQQINKVSEQTAQTAIEEVAGKNRKGKNQNYFLGREEAIESLGGDNKTSKDKQIFMNIVYNIWWYIMMILLGIPYVAPLKVLLNLAKALSPVTIANIEEDGKVRTEEVKQTHWLPLTFALLFYVAYLVGLGFLIYYILKAII